MTLLKNPKANAFFIAIISIIYALLFIITSNHMEFKRFLSHSSTLNSRFWNLWSDFISDGNMIYFGYVIIILAVVNVLLLLLKKKKYDEYQVNILAKGLIAAGIISIIMLPIACILVISDPNYVIEILFLLLTLQWTGTLVVDLIYTAKYFK